MNSNNRKKCPVIVLCLLFVFSIFIIPAIVGIILYIRNVRIDKENKKLTEELETNRQAELNHLKSLLTPEQNEAINLEKEIFNYKKQISDLKTEISNKQDDISAINRKISELTQKESTIKSEIYNYTEMVEMQQFGIYQPTYKFANSDLYKDKLKSVRELQKESIKSGTACSGNMGWTVNGSSSQGKKMVKDMQKLLLRAFNVECDDIIDNVKISNFDKSKERIIKSAEQISKLGVIMSISITAKYINLKINELCLALDFEQKKQEEKELLRELKEQQREEAKAQKEIEEARKKLQKEQMHYQNALIAINEQLAKNPDDLDLQAKKRELELNIEDTNKAISNVDYREANKRAGYVYVISNIGAFGEGVYKIGMTRRLEPMERVYELGDASVPFNFDVHALIFTEDAPKLEAALHNAFDKQKVNKINSRREFFRVSLDEIKRVVRENFDKTVEWIDIPEAEQYRQSLIISET